MPASHPASFALSRYVEVFKGKSILGPTTPFGPGYDILFDATLKVDGWKEIRVWTHVFIENFTATPLTDAARLGLRFLHEFGTGDSFDYESADLPFSGITSYISGYAIKPLIGTKLRLLCHPVGLPAGPYTMSLTYLLVR